MLDGSKLRYWDCEAWLGPNLFDGEPTNKSIQRHKRSKQLLPDGRGLKDAS
jgi:hypothetical protein